MAYFDKETEALKKRIADRGYSTISYLERIAGRIENSRLVRDETKGAVYSVLSEAYNGIDKGRKVLYESMANSIKSSLLLKKVDGSIAGLRESLKDGRELNDRLLETEREAFNQLKRSYESYDAQGQRIEDAKGSLRSLMEADRAAQEAIFRSRIREIEGPRFEDIS